jgi:hypothetical protein
MGISPHGKTRLSCLENGSGLGYGFLRRFPDRSLTALWGACYDLPLRSESCADP